MTTAQRSKPSLLRDKRGLTTVEYIIVLGLIAIFGVAAWRAFGVRVEEQVRSATDQMNVVTPASGGGTTPAPGGSNTTTPTSGGSI